MATITTLVALNVANNVVLDERLYVPVNLAAAGILVVLARHRGLTADELAVDRGDLRRGVRLGAGAAAAIVVAVAAVVGVALALFPDAAAAAGANERSLSAGRLAYTLLVRIPLGTALTEEVLFRSVLFGVLRRHTSTVGATVWSSVLFGLWHVLPTVDPASAVSGGTPTVVATVLLTGGAGAALVWLRLRARHVVAPVLAHAGINATALVVATIL